MLAEKSFNSLDNLGDILNEILSENVISNKIVIFNTEDRYIGYYNGSSVNLENLQKGPYIIKYIKVDLEEVDFNQILKNKNRKMIIARRDKCELFVNNLIRDKEQTNVVSYLNSDNITNKLNVYTHYSNLSECDYKLTFEDIEANDWSIYFLD